MRLSTQLARHCLHEFFRLRSQLFWIVIVSAALHVGWQPFLAGDEIPLDANTKSQASKNPSTPDKIKLPDALSGKVLDMQGSPVPNATINVQLFLYHPPLTGINPMDWTTRFLSAESDSQGNFSLDTRGLEVDSKYGFTITGTISAPGFLRLKYRHTVENPGDEIPLPDATLRTGRHITGRVVAPDDGDQPLRNPVVYFSVQDRDVRKWWPNTVFMCQADGRFDAHVPQGVELSIFASSDEFAQVQKKVSAGQSLKALGRLPLNRGTSVIGQVLDLEGEPVVGAVVTINEEPNKEPVAGARPQQQFPEFSCSAKTDEQGRFRLPPCVGRFRVTLQAYGKEHGTRKNIYADGTPPVIAPRMIELPGREGDLELVLQEIDTVTISGVVHWADGSSAYEVQAFASVMIDSRGSNVARTKTDMGGYYELTVPRDTGHIVIFVPGSTHASGEYHYAHSTRETTDKPHQMQYLHLRNVTVDIKDADWELRRKIE